ncbi:MAG TPA: TIGR01777 family oxidoreductase [Desulfomicrobiaceae bacterium]|nr:TIGR01777 family oxidoreductase [Desulfomicrobiaceae bacterium]
MHFFILGGTGFIGRYLIRHLLDAGHRITALVRSGSGLSLSHPSLSLVEGDPTRPGPWQERVQEAETVINLVGAPVSVRWTEKAKQSIMDTRVQSTRMVVQAMQNRTPGTLICANAIGFFGDRGNEILDDHDSYGVGFLAEVTRKWQEEAEKAGDFGHRVVITRFPLVLGSSGGALKEMLPIFKLGLGGRIGPGTQWFSWVHIQDLARAILFTAEHDTIRGPVNMCAPNPVTNKDFTRSLAATLKRPAILPVPSAAVRLVAGEAADLVLSSLRCRPRVLANNAFTFTFLDLDQALKDLLRPGR